MWQRTHEVMLSCRDLCSDEFRVAVQKAESNIRQILRQHVSVGVFQGQTSHYSTAAPFPN